MAHQYQRKPRLLFLQLVSNALSQMGSFAAVLHLLLWFVFSRILDVPPKRMWSCPKRLLDYALVGAEAAD
jgi:hypothetical protein